MAVNLSPVGGVAAQFFDNSGNVLTGGLLYSYLAGTTTPAVTYTSSNGITANSNPVVLDAAGRVPSSGEIWLTDGLSYKFILQDQNSVQIASWDNIVGINSNFIAYTGQSQTITATQSQTVFTLTGIQYQPATNNLAVYVNGSKQISGVNYQETSSTIVTFIDGLNVGDVVQFSTASPISSSSTSADNVSYNEGDIDAIYRSVTSKLQESVSVLDFGADPTGADDATAAIQAATNTGKPVFFPAGIYKMLSPVTYTGTVVWSGVGADSIIKCDSTVIDVTSGSNSLIDNLYLTCINYPSIISRNVNTWASNPPVVASSSSSHAGYQPTVNDTDLSPTPTYTTVGPVIYFQQNATNITVSRIYGNFVTVQLYDATYSTVRDCVFQGGAGLGGIVFWNINNQQGERNAAINNNITYASNSGIAFARNFDGIAQGNIVSYCGESGIKTWQNTSGGTNARCYHMQFIGNTTMYQYYDGFDFSSDYPHTGTIDSRHQIENNMTYGNYRTGFYADGINNQFIGNNARACQLSGYKLTYGQSLISNNFAWGCNASNTVSGEHQMGVVGDSNTISNNYLNAGGVTAGYGLYAPGSNVVTDNQGYSCSIFLGNTNAVTAQTMGNVGSNVSIQGTFTPTFIVGTTAQSTSIASGVYTKIGRRVVFDLTIQHTGSVTGTGNISIGFGAAPAVGSNGVYGSVCGVVAQNASYTGVLSGLINDGSTGIGLILNTNGALTFINETNVTAATKFFISGSYLTAQ